MTGLKQVIVVRQDLKMSKGKMAAQVAHASTEATLKSGKEEVKAWQEQGMKKAVLKCKNEKELLSLKKKAQNAGLVTALITDAGHTHLAPGTKTCVAIGPDKEEKIDRITGHLKLVS